METACPSEILVSTYKPTRSCNPEDRHWHYRSRQNLNDQIKISCHFLHFSFVCNISKKDVTKLWTFPMNISVSPSLIFVTDKIQKFSAEKFYMNKNKSNSSRQFPLRFLLISDSPVNTLYLLQISVFYDDLTQYCDDRRYIFFFRK